VVDYGRLKNEELKTHIDQFGKSLFVRPRTDAIRQLADGIG